MDLPANVDSHYEYQISRNFKQEAQVKASVFQKLPQLHGWCTNLKAGVLMDLVFNHRPKIVVEVGIWGGKSLIPLAFALKHLNQGIVYGIDPWKTEESVIGFDDANADWWGMVDHEAVMNDYLGKVCQFGLSNYVRTLRQTSADAEPIYNIDLLHIDGNHSEESSLFDVQKWVPLVKPGGIIVFDDVDWRVTDKAVDWLDKNCLRATVFFKGNAWGIWVKGK